MANAKRNINPKKTISSRELDASLSAVCQDQFKKNPKSKFSKQNQQKNIELVYDIYKEGISSKEFREKHKKSAKILTFSSKIINSKVKSSFYSMNLRIAGPIAAMAIMLIGLAFIKPWENDANLLQQSLTKIKNTKSLPDAKIALLDEKYSHKALAKHHRARAIRKRLGKKRPSLKRKKQKKSKNRTAVTFGKSPIVDKNYDYALSTDLEKFIAEEEKRIEKSDNQAIRMDASKGESRKISSAASAERIKSKDLSLSDETNATKTKVTYEQKKKSLFTKIEKDPQDIKSVDSLRQLLKENNDQKGLKRLQKILRK